MTRKPGHPSRRAVLLGATGGLVGVAACSGGSSHTAPSQSTTARSGAASAASGSDTASPPTTQAATLPRTTPWRPTSAEITPAAKLRAVQVVEAIGAWPEGKAGAAAAKARVAALRLPTGLVDEAGPLLPDADAAALQVVDAQYGGILTDSASVLVVCRQWTRRAGTVSAGGTTVDVRLTRAASGWTVTALHPARPGAAASALPVRAREVLSDSRVELPPAAQADLRSGRVHDSVLAALLRLAGSYRMYVSVVRSGHPLDVFGTSRPSDHPLGRAFDVWQIDGHAVVDPATSRSLIERFMRDAAAAGSYNVGGPVLLSGGAAANQFFSDDTHHDHVHIGFDR
ncbi:hypothetical protein [Streptomyces guryensis]|uniref:Extensin-like protein C-terminus n=1 Tax=Streptomyces guryensis TaxID=2886947 RepID=A0A9Q3Z793_9ACTN|nr:hypothetical protein [Streptomyces guryensis]MCD9877916.1 hypothetical protein [Streptomyces guryensis]